ncbi:MAG: gluconate 2-dehydrogenase subunit 3 family protein [Thalassotalea sp.]
MEKSPKSLPPALEAHGEKRRQLVMGLLASVGAINIAGCVAPFDALAKTINTNPNEKTVELGFYTVKEYQLVSRLADLIIPDTETAGALTVGVPLLIDKLHQTWAAEPAKAAHRQAIRQIQQELTSIAKADFLTLSAQQQQQALQTLDDNAFSSEKKRLAGYRKVKELIAKFYYLSEVGATQELRYFPVPGRWDACIPIKEIDTTWAV